MAPLMKLQTVTVAFIAQAPQLFFYFHQPSKCKVGFFFLRDSTGSSWPLYSHSAWSQCHTSCNLLEFQGTESLLAELVVFFMHCMPHNSLLCSGNDEWSHWILGKMGSWSLDHCWLPCGACWVYFKTFTWVITVMEEHLRPQLGLSGGPELKRNLWVLVVCSWLRKWGQCLNQGMIFVNLLLYLAEQ